VAAWLLVGNESYGALLMISCPPLALAARFKALMRDDLPLFGRPTTSSM
jgi:hypothetical protein